MINAVASLANKNSFDFYVGFLEGKLLSEGLFEEAQSLYSHLIDEKAVKAPREGSFDLLWSCPSSLLLWHIVTVAKENILLASQKVIKPDQFLDFFVGFLFGVKVGNNTFFESFMEGESVKDGKLFNFLLHISSDFEVALDSLLLRFYQSNLFSRYTEVFSSYRSFVCWLKEIKIMTDKAFLERYRKIYDILKSSNSYTSNWLDAVCRFEETEEAMYAAYRVSGEEDINPDAFVPLPLLELKDQIAELISAKNSNGFEKV